MVLVMGIISIAVVILSAIQTKRILNIISVILILVLILMTPRLRRNAPDPAGRVEASRLSLAC